MLRKKASLNIFMFAPKGSSNDDVGAARDTVFQEIRPGAGFKTGDDFVKAKSWGCYRKTTPPEKNPVTMSAGNY